MSLNLLSNQTVELSESSVTASEDISIGTGDGTTPTFSASLTYAIIPNTLSIALSDGSVSLHDDGNGTIIDDAGATYGTTDYVNTISLTFPTPPDQYVTITGTYTYTSKYTYTYEITRYISVDGFVNLYYKYSKGQEDSLAIALKVSPDNANWFTAMNDDNSEPLIIEPADGDNLRNRQRVVAGDNVKFVITLIKTVVPNTEIAKFTQGDLTLVLA